MEEERREIIIPDEGPTKIIPRRKVTLKLIEERSLRKACYKKRREGLLKKMREITTFCDIDACIIICSPDEAVPTVWPSPAVAKRLIQRLQSIPESERCKRMVDHHSFIQDKVKRMERMLTRVKEINEEKQMTLFIYQICCEGKPVSDFNLDEAKRLLHYVDQRLKQLRLRIGGNDSSSSSSAMSNNMELIIPTNSTYGDKEFVQANFGDLNYGSDDDSMMLPSQRDDFGSRVAIGGTHPTMMMPYGNVGGFSGRRDMVMLQPQSHFGGLIGGKDSMMSSYGNFGGFNGENNFEILPLSNFGGRIGGSTSTMLPHNNFGGFRGESKLGMLLTQSNFGGFNSASFEGFNNGKSGFGSAPPQNMFEVLNSALDRLILAQANNNFGAHNGENDLMGVAQFNSRGINGEENLGVLHGDSTTEIGGSSNWAPYGIGSATCENGIGTDEYNNENHNGPINDITGFQQFNLNKFGPNNNSEAAMGEFNAYYFGSSNGAN